MKWKCQERELEIKVTDEELDAWLYHDGLAHQKQIADDLKAERERPEDLDVPF